jgi:tripartite-type tricarboxylate transporter receptor subunit TctC
MKRTTRHATSMLAVLLAFPAAAALAQPTYPTKPIRLLVGFAPGGGTDLTARVIAQKLDEAFGQRVIVDNRPGASQIIASELTARANPDGYTMLMSAAGLTINPAFNSKLPFDTLRDFGAIAMVARAPNVLVVSPGSAARTVKDIIDLAKAKPGQLAYGSGGVSAPSHVSGALFAAMAGVQLTHVPYKGTGPAMIDVLSGQLPIAFPDMTAALAHIKSGRIPAIAVTTRDRFVLLPTIPTVAESGLPGYECSSWFGIIGPAGIPKPVVAKLNETINRALKTSEVRDMLSTQGLAAVGGSAEEFAATISTELVKWKKLVVSTGLKTE